MLLLSLLLATGIGTPILRVFFSTFSDHQYILFFYFCIKMVFETTGAIDIKIRCKNVYIFLLEFITSTSKCMQISPFWLLILTLLFRLTHVNLRYLKPIERKKIGEVWGRRTAELSAMRNFIPQRVIDSEIFIQSFESFRLPSIFRPENFWNRRRRPIRLSRVSGTVSCGLLNRSFGRFEADFFLGNKCRKSLSSVLQSRFIIYFC